MDTKKIIEHLNRSDRFCAFNHIAITDAEPGRAEAELTVTPDSLNGMGVVQGGAIFTLADFAFAAAANAGNQSTVTLTGTINFTRPGRGPKLIARAKERFRSRHTAVYSIEVTDSDGKLVAEATGTGFVTGQPLLEEKQPLQP